jgi:hypothetical protein
MDLLSANILDKYNDEINDKRMADVFLLICKLCLYPS